MSSNSVYSNACFQLQKYGMCECVGVCVCVYNNCVHLEKRRASDGDDRMRGVEPIENVRHHHANDDDTVKLFNQNAQIRTVSGRKIKIIDREKGLFLVH